MLKMMSPATFSFTKLNRLVFYILWAFVILLGIHFSLRGFERNLFNPEISASITMIIHISVSTIALIAGPIQFSNTIRTRWRSFHRKAGWLYVSCVIISVPAAYKLAFKGFCSECTPPFLIWTTLWLLTTLIAVVMAVQKNFIAHKQFMIRSYVLLNGFVFTRIDEFLPFPLPEGPEINRPSMIIWLVWVVPLVITEFWLTWIPAIMGKNRKNHS